MHRTLVYIHSHAVDHLKGMGNRSPVVEFIDQLETNPEISGDYLQPDPRGRMMEVKILGRQAVIFFKDPFAGIVKILEVRNVEAA